MRLPIDVRHNVARNLWIMREAHGLSRQQVAQGLGLPLDTVTAFEQGRPLPSAAEIQIMSRWYDMQVCDVFRRPDNWRTVHRDFGEHCRMGLTVADNKHRAGLKKGAKYT